MLSILFVFSVYTFNLSILCYISYILIFFFKQKTAYEMRISDWSSDVLLFRSSAGTARLRAKAARPHAGRTPGADGLRRRAARNPHADQIRSRHAAPATRRRTAAIAHDRARAVVRQLVCHPAQWPAGAVGRTAGTRRSLPGRESGPRHADRTGKSMNSSH